MMNRYRRHRVGVLVQQAHRCDVERGVGNVFAQHTQLHRDDDGE